MKKYIIIGGCSYGLRSIESIGEILKLNPNELEYVQINISAASSKYISESIMIYCDSLLNQGIQPENILVINNFTQVGRTNPILPKELKNEIENKVDITEYRKQADIPFKFYNHFIQIKNRLYSLMIGSGKAPTSVKNWLKEKEHYYTEIKNPLTHFEEYLSYIVVLQTYLKSKNISIISYMMNNVFEGWDIDLSHCYTKHKKWELPSTIDYKHISELSSITKILWDLIDTSKFVFYTTKNNKYGGIDEYFIDKFKDKKYLDSDDYPNMVFYGNHPNEPVYVDFIKNLLKPKLQEWNKQNLL